MEIIKQLVSDQKQRLFFYSPYNFLREVGFEKNLIFLESKLNPWLTNQNQFFIFQTDIENSSYYFLYQFLNWDSDYFKYPTYKLFLVLYPNADPAFLHQATAKFKAHLAEKGPSYCFIDIPAEDTQLIQALTGNGFRLTETRLTYYHDQLNTFDHLRFPVRAATTTDIPALRKVACEARNDFDRYHADTFFTTEQADEYLATYAEACVKSLCETVLIPNEEGLPTDAFLAISRLQPDAEKLGVNLARVVLTAVGPACKGWHVKLVAETMQYAKSHNCNYLLMTTQATNRAVFRTSEKLGLKLGSTTHILSITF